MAVYICDYCNSLKDDDYEPMVECPIGKYDFICEDCAGEIEEKYEVIPGTREALEKLKI